MVLFMCNSTLDWFRILTVTTLTRAGANLPMDHTCKHAYRRHVLTCRCEPLKALDGQQLLALCNSLQIVRLSQGQMLLRPGSPIEALYVVTSGKLMLTRSPQAPRELQPGDYFGEEVRLFHFSTELAKPLIQPSRI